MAFTIPNHADADSAFQAEPDSVDFDILAAGYSGSGIISGCAVTAQGSPNMTVAVAAGIVSVAGVRASVTGANATIGTADGTNPRFDMITVNNSGTIATTAGTAASVPELPSIPSNSVVLALIFVPASDTTIATAQITDKRVFVSSGAAGGVLDDIIMGIGSDSDIAILNRSTSLSADAEVTNIIEGTSDHLGVAANSLIVSNVTNDGDILFVVSDGGNSKGLLKLDGANGRVVIHGGDLLMSGAQKIYFFDVGGEYMSSDGSTLTITGATALTPTIGSTAWANANHAHAASNSGGTLTTLGTVTTGVWNGTAIATGYIAADAITGAKIADDAIDSEHYTDGSIDTAHLASDVITGAKIADDAIDSEHYTDGSIDTAHLASDVITGAKIADDAIDSEHYTDGSIDTAHLAADAVTGAKLADNAVDSEHYTDGSIDNAHIADDAIDSEHYAAGSIDTAHIADNQVTAAKLADIARGSILYGNASAATAELTKGSANTVLTSDGTDISWAAAASSDISAHVSDASTQTIPDNSRTAINFDTDDGAEDHDTSTFHSTASNNTRLTAPSTGKYIVSGGFYLANATNSGVYGASIYKQGSIVNGTSMRTFPDVTSEHRYQNVTGIIQLDATEYVELIASLDAAGESVSLGAQAFSIIKIA